MWAFSESFMAEIYMAAEKKCMKKTQEPVSSWCVCMICYHFSLLVGEGVFMSALLSIWYQPWAVSVCLFVCLLCICSHHITFRYRTISRKLQLGFQQYQTQTIFRGHRSVFLGLVNFGLLCMLCGVNALVSTTSHMIIDISVTMVTRCIIDAWLSTHFNRQKLVHTQKTNDLITLNTYLVLLLTVFR